MTENSRKGIISLSITDKGALYSSFMSYTKNGGLFVPSARTYNLGDEVFILLRILDDNSMSAITGKVVWITPKGAQGRKASGIGVQFDESFAEVTRDGIEQHLAANLKGERPTQTM